MKVAFFSNYMNHHQLPFSLAMMRETDNNYVFVATEKVSQARLDLGYRNMDDDYPFIIKAYESKDNESAALKLALESDVVILGSAPEFYITERIKAGKLTFRYSERLYKCGYSWLKMPIRILRHYEQFNKYRKNHYLLCAGAYTAFDYSLTGSYINRTFKWGYFPEVKVYDNIENFLNQKKKASILWVGRLIDWKHPETAVNLAKRLSDDGYNFNLSIIGTGELYEKLDDMIHNYHLDESVHLLGAMNSEKVREYMEQIEIFLFTSDRNEGWGAVLNESMNSACAVVANKEIGSVPFLISNEKNGYIYNSENQLYDRVKYLLDHRDKCRLLGLNAYKTMISTWNADMAAKRLILLSDGLLHGKKIEFLDGPCSIEKKRKNWS